MAISAKFSADFSDFQTAVAKADVQLKSFEQGAGKVQASLKKMSDSLTGTKLIQDATLMVQAVEKVGGVSKLTASELAKVGATATEAANKLRALGQDVPQGIQKIADAAKNLEPKLTMADRAAGLLQSTFGQFTAAGLATQVISKATDELGRMAGQGMKIGALQGAFDRLATGIGQNSEEMRSAMAVGTRGLVSDFNLIESANKAMLLGLPVTSASMGDLAKTATMLGKAMGQDATKSLDDLITALGRSSPMILDNLGLSVKVGEANEEYARKIHKTVDALTDAEKKMAFYEAAMEAARVKTEQLGEQTKTLGEIATTVWTKFENGVTSGVSVLNTGLGAAMSSWDNYFRYLRDSGGGLFPGLGIAKAAIDEQARAAAAGGAANRPKSLNTDPMGGGAFYAKLAEDAKKAIEEIEATWKKEDEAAKKYGNTIDGLFRKLSGADAAEEMRNLDTVFRRMAASGQITEQQVRAIAKEAADLSEQGAKLTPRLWAIVQATDQLAPSFDFSATAIAKLGTQFDLALPKLDAFNAAVLDLEKKTSVGIPDVGQRASPLSTPKALPPGLFGSSEQIGAALSSSILGAIQGGGNPVTAAAGTIGSTVGSNIAWMLKKDGTKMFQGALGGIFSAALPVVGSLIGPLAGALWNKLFGTAGRDAVVDFANTFSGGFDGPGGLHEALNTLGAEGERLWIKLTQGTGRNNPEQARRTIDEITAALARQKDKTAEAAQAAAEASKVQQDELDKITSKYSDTISKLDSEYQSLSDSIAKEAKEDVMGLVETKERARRDQVAAEKLAQEAMRDAEIAAKKESFAEALSEAEKLDKTLREMFERGYRSPVRFYVPDGMPGDPSPTYTGPLTAPASAQTAPSQVTTQVFLDRRMIAESVTEYARDNGLSV